MHPALAARRRHIAALRRRVVAAVLATFVLAWGAVVWDGSMGATTTTAQTTHDHDDDGDGDPRARRDEDTRPASSRRSPRGSPDGRALLLDHEPLRGHRGAARLERGRRARAADEPAARATDLRTLHEALSLATMVALAVHAFALLGDGYLKPSLADVTIPFVIDYERWWTALGIVGGWLFVILGLSYYVRGKIGPARWRKLHRFTALAWVLGVVHALGAGTDAGAVWFLLAAAAAVIPAGALLARRLVPAHMRLPLLRHDAAASGARAPRTRAASSRPGTSASAASGPTASSAAATPTRAPPSVSATMARLLAAVREAADATGGLVDGTLVRRDRGRRLPPRPRRAAAARALALAPPRARRAAPARAIAAATASRRRRARSTAAASPRACSRT